MTVAKFAISMPRETMRRVDRAAKRLKMTRSRYIATVLDRVARRERNASLAKEIDDALAEIGEQDLASVAHLAAAGKREGTEW